MQFLIRHRHFVAGLLAVLTLLSLVAGVWRRGSDDSLEQVRERGELRIGYALEAPYALIRADGRPGGESPEVAREVAQRLGVRPAWVLTEFDRLIPELEDGRFDVIAAGLFITPQRRERVRFSRPTLRVRPGWLRRAGTTAQLGPYREAASRPNVRVAVVAGSVEATFFEAKMTDRGALLIVPDARTGREAVASGRSDALALSLPTVALMASQAPDRLVAEPAEGPGATTNLVGLAVRRDDEHLAQSIDEALDGYLGSPAHLDLLRPFGLGAADVPESSED
ncbi:MAG: transporter substrate-binding domain-containing protein [Piscinibacter sp.]|uniref:transporter substrate-binding domain-containing protein n=1 Tax=Piscinibacter sp. TaxID=1903157 RepID=UPI003D09744F